MNNFLRLASESHEPITLNIDRLNGHSSGGNTEAALRFAHIIETAPFETIGIAGEATSAGAFIFLACKRKLIRRDGVIGLHTPVLQIPFVDIAEDGKVASNVYAYGKKMFEQTAEFVRRKVPPQEAEKVIRSVEVIEYDAQDALRLGLADDIAP